MNFYTNNTAINEACIRAQLLYGFKNKKPMAVKSKRPIKEAVALIVLASLSLAAFKSPATAQHGPILAKSELSAKQIAHLDLAKPERRHVLR